MSFDEGEYSAPSHLNNFLRFHINNPDVFESLSKVAFDVFMRGYGRWSISAVMSVVRYNHMTTHDDLSSFKLNDHYAPFYARLLIEEYPNSFTGFFKLKKQKCRTEDKPILEHLKEYRELYPQGE